MRFKGILLDLDNTIYPYQTCHEPALAAVVEYLSPICGASIEVLCAKYGEARTSVKKKTLDTAAGHDRLLYFQRMCEMLSLPPYELAPLLDELYWSAYMDCMEFRPHFEEFLKAVKPIPIAIVTDLTTRRQLQKIVRLGLQEHVSAVVTSEEAGHDKPHPDIFVMAAEKLCLEPASLCMIGDSWEKDIVGALQFGMHCYWFKDDLTSLPSSELQTRDGLELVHEFKSFRDLIGQVATIV
jgi:2-haloacid dehalogenase